MRCGRRLGPHRPSVFDNQLLMPEIPQFDANVDPARMLDALIVFVWWEEERAGLHFNEIGLVDCRDRLLDKGHVRRARMGGGTGGGNIEEDWLEVDRMKVCTTATKYANVGDVA